MKSYLIKFILRADVEGLTTKEKAAVCPQSLRVGDSDSRRATNQVINLLKNSGKIRSGRELIIVEAKVVG